MTKWDRVFVFTEDGLGGERPYPYTRTTRTQKWVDERWDKYQTSTATLRILAKQQMAHEGWEIIKRGIPLSVSIVLFTGKGRDYHDRDADNEQKGIFDALQGIVYEGDAWIDDLSMTRVPSNFVMLVVRIKIVDYDWLIRKAFNLTEDGQSAVEDILDSIDVLLAEMTEEGNG